MAKKTAPTIIDISRSQLSLCTITSPNPVAVKFPASAVSDLEVVDQNELNNLVKSLIASQKLKASPLIIVFGPETYFEKNLTGIPDAQRQVEVQAFIDSVPVQSVASKIFRQQNTDRLVVINRHFYDCLKAAFEVLGFTVAAVVPAFVLGEAGAKPEFTGATCRLVLKKQDYIQENSFITPDSGSSSRLQEQRFLKAHKGLVILVSLMFIAFSIVMAFMTLTRRQPALKPVPVVHIRPTPAVTPAVTSAAASPSATVSDLSVNVENGSGVTGLANRVESRLRDLGYTNIKTGNSSVSAQTTLVFFSPRVSTPLRDQLVTELKKIFSAISARDTAESGFDINITAGQTTP